MESEEGLHILPLALHGCDACTPYTLGVGDKLVYDAQAFGLHHWILLECLLDISTGFCRPNAMGPVLHARAVDFAVHVLLAGNATEDEEGVVLAIADFSGQTDGGEAVDELLEAVLSLSLVCAGRCISTLSALVLAKGAHQW